LSLVADDLVLSELDGAVLTLTLHNPERRNAWSVAMEEQYFSLLDQADDDPDVRAIVLTGSGTTFCPGLDVDERRPARRAQAATADLSAPNSQADRRGDQRRVRRHRVDAGVEL
jgi:enoyl-CoA hydratase/carnithine racemase